MIPSKSLFIATIASLVLTNSTLAIADPHDRGWHHYRDGYPRYYDYPRWRAGHWYHGDHGGRLGWWWIAAGTWYFYPAPVYPYPSPYEPPVVVEQAPPPETVWYYCESSRNYYPYASVCPEGWRTVPAQPRDAYER